MRKKLIIELRSDLCAGNGKGFAQVIDIDTAVDACGIPYIPGRRIKGCMREIAKDVLQENQEIINRIFGVPGSNRPGSLFVSDARIENYDKQLEQIRFAVDAEELKPNDVTELFCSVRAATALENDTVKDGSLRFVRVVNRISPIDKRPLKFYADVYFDDDIQENVSRLTSGLRNIGYHRNRGLGYVKCTLEDFDEEKNPEISLGGSIDDETPCILEYLIYLEGDLMLPESDANHSMDYIPGTSVLGAMAYKYLKQVGEDGDDFDELFLSDQVRFSNVYISDREGTDYVPAPGFLAKIKAEGPEEETGIHNQVAEEEEIEKRRKQGEATPQYKPLKKGYISFGKGYIEPKTKIVYHNAINTEDGGLYTQYCISGGQYYKGRIEAPGRLLKKLKPLFDDKVLYFGRSKTSQYARCQVVNAEWRAVKSETVDLKDGKIAAFLCESDIVPICDGRYTVGLEALCKKLEGAANIQITSESINRFTNITSANVSGYNAKWNMKKPQHPVIKAGSVVLFRVKESQKDLAVRYTIGAKQNEGFGRVRLLPDAGAISIPKNPAVQKKQEEVPCAVIEAVKMQKENDEILKKGIGLASEILKSSLNSSQIGRLTLMCKEASDYDNFLRRIKSIKTDKTRTSALSCFEEKKLPEDLKMEWKKQQKLFLAALTVSKYELRAGGEKDV